MGYEDFVKSFKNNKIEAIDRAYVGTAESQGTYQARLALKYILFNDKPSFEQLSNIEDKYEFISAKRGGRELIKLLDMIDIYQILAKFAMASFAMENKPFTIDLKEFKKIRKNKRIKIPQERIIEYVAFASYIDHYETFMFFSTRKNLAIKLFDLLIDQRYKDEKLVELDKFNGVINNSAIKKQYLKQYQSLDDTYYEIRTSINI